MAPLWHLLFLNLSTLLLVAAYRLPFLSQRGIPMEGHNLRLRSESPPGAPVRWEWNTGGGGDVPHEFPQQPRRKRMATNDPPTISPPTLNNTGPSFVVMKTSFHIKTTITTTLVEDDTDGVTGTSPVTKNITPTTTTTTGGLVEDDTTEGTIGISPVTMTILVEANTTESITSTTRMSTDGILKTDTTEGVATTGKIPPQTSSSGGTGMSIAAFNGKMGVTTRKGSLVEMTTPRTLVESMDSTATPTQSMVPHFRAKGTVMGILGMASSTSTTVKTKPPQMSPSIPNLVGKCLLAIFLLALVAGIFIVITAVLAVLLWRQKRAYKLSRHNHTEMVCISSLLADEMEEAGGRHPRVRRMRMLGENGSEAEMDNLTLNSFLPDH